ncbi:MAG: 2-octaprenyl-6-methoxyphenyl hydroxylase [Rhodospirillaceae bacterium]|nr:2-octaprenyl-6-methoxyphenyl hydroxylase [Rhodospirillaceae bacterium]
MNTHCTDTLIVGGGPVGGSLACALASAGISSVVVDRVPAAELLAPNFDGRATAVAQGPKKMLEQIGVWQALGTEVAPIRDIRVADGRSNLFLHYDHADVREDALGYMVENQHLRHAVLTAVTDAPAIMYLAPNEIDALEHSETAVIARLKGGDHITAPLIIGADGRNSFVRDHAGLELTQWPYHQSGIVCTIAHEEPHHNIAHEHFYPAGPFAILPLTGNRSSIVWTESEVDAADIMALPDDDFIWELTQRAGDFMGALEVVGPRWSYPLSLQYTKTSTAPRLALAGDAAHGVHPIAGQGLNMGLRDVAALAEVLADARRLGLDIGSTQVLRKYDRWRRFDNTMMLAATDVLNRLFSNDIAPIRMARDLGLAAVNRIGPLKQFLMRQAMGLTGTLPRLLKGESL